MARMPEAVAPAAAGVDPMTPRIARVRRRWRDGPDVWTLDIADPDEAAFAPGQFNMLTVFGMGEVPISVSGSPDEAGRLIHTIRAVGPVSTALTRLKRGDAVGLRGPFGTAWPTEAARGRDVVVVAGGLGLAPLRPALYRLLAERQRHGKLVLLYGTRDPAGILFRKEIEDWRRRLDVEIEVTVDRADRSWRGHVGVVTTLIPHVTFDPANTTAMVCGPEIMMRFAIAALGDAGIAPEAIFLSMERNMKCAIGLCGHCQFGGDFICRDGAVFPYDRVRARLGVKEL
jgi:NAD(P)H-flavin reductase